MEKMTHTEMLLEALEIGLDAAQDVAAETHARYAGYKPHRHAAVDEAVRKIEAAIASLKAAAAPAERQALRQMTEDDAAVREWYFDCDGHYIDVARDENGKFSIYFRDRSDQKEGWFDQAEIAGK